MLKNVIIINDFAHINGGAGQVALSSAIALARRGFRVIVFAAVGPIMPGLRESGAEIVITSQHEILKDRNRPRAAVQGIWNVKALEKMDSLLKSYDPADTIVHVHSWTKALSSSVLHAAVKKGFKLICTTHDYFSVCPNGGLFDFQRSEICSESPLSLGCLTKNCDTRSYPQKLWRVVRQFAQNKIACVQYGIQCYITVSDYSESLLCMHLPPTARFFRVMNPVDMRKDRPSCAENNDKFTFVGRLSPEKGCVLFAASARRAGVKAVFAGSGEDERNILAANPAAEFLGWQGREGVAEAICSSRAVVFPSLLHETQGLAVLEAAALGIPALVSDMCAARDNIINGETGLLFRAGNGSDLAEKLRLLNEDAELAGRLGRAAYERYWSDPPTLERHLEGLIECYRSVLADTGHGDPQ